MATKHTIKYWFVILIVISCNNSTGQNPVNWTNDQLTEPADFAATLKSNKNAPLIFSVGPAAVIPGSIDIGMVKDQNNLEKLKKQISNLPKTENILIYCGCCPFDRCPNVRPAIALLKSLQFTNYHLLNLPHNIKTDWIAKGYPTSE